MLGWLRLSFSILLLFFPLSAAVAASASEPAIVLQLPPGMTAGQVRELVGSLQDKGAAIVPDAKAVPAEEPIVQQIRLSLRRAVPKAPALLDLPRMWRAELAAEGVDDHGFWPKIILAVIGALTLELAVRAVLPALVGRLRIPAGTPLHAAFGRHFVSIAGGLAAFVVAIRLGGGLLGQGSALLTAMAAQIVASAINWRIATAFLALVVAPGLGWARPLYLDDPGARRVSRWLSVYLAYAMVLVPAVWLVGRIGNDRDLVLDAALALGIVVTLYKTAMFLHIAAPVSAAIILAGGEHPSAGRRLAAALWHWLFIVLSVVLFLLALEQYALGNSANTSGAASALQVVIVGMSLSWAAKQRFIHEYGRHARSHWWRPVVNRAVDLAVLIGGLAWLTRLWGFDVFDPNTGGITAAVLRPAFRASVTLAIAWLVWSAIGGFLKAHAPHGSGGAGDEDVAVETSMTRLATLLPLIRNTLAIAIFFLGTVIALGDLGVDIGPLLAGAGVVGIALGFGAQALVRDVIAGLFFLIDDAFRLGEYIDTGRLKGTVEAISIRSVRLRHQSGLVHTIPFGQIQAVTNSSRDWAIVKFNLHVAPDSDLELVRKTIKQLGLSFLEDPEIGGDFIEPLKMQGVADVTQGAIMIRCKFTARPIRPSYLRRQALRQIILRFAGAGIAFATPPATASNPL
ncbi:MAG TPA: mechanosensitive ion channel domain-containing protein [Aliidongia sp.]|uniref:mechanosensitive ion channel family protein n=1 Tax=Aliidongia sp. TaxID=1914230 RepID=UPI002DDDB3BE|nr:mechanosensitive ion channel domain-containing protein [Aliidongia sp.]HEV2678672.1 mechanosensitive ion channel domain-containing protein [Aliidongia sp.]